MKPSAARLLLLNGAPAYRRLAGIMAGVAVGVAMLLILLGAFIHIPDREARAAWVVPDGTYAEYDETTEEPIARPMSDGMMLAALDADTVDGNVIQVLTVATAQSTSVDFPADLPPLAPGQFYASPAVATLLESASADQLSDRWGEYMGEIPAEALKGPSQMVVLAGGSWSDMDTWSNSILQAEFRHVAATSESVPFRIVMAMGAIALLVPITLFISIVSALGAADRRERFATARLIGAGRRAMAAVSGAEMTLASLVGGVIGIGLAAALRPLAAQLSISGSTMTLADLTPSLAWTAAVILGISVLSGVTAYVRTYRDDVGALGATREREEKRVTGWRASLLVLGLAVFGGATWAVGNVHGVAAQMSAVILLGFALVAFGIVVAGPWVTRLASQLLGKTTSSAAGVVAAGRLQRHPRATFRSVAGLVVAVFVVSVFAGGSSAITPMSEPRDLEGRLDLTTVVTNVNSTTDAEKVAAAVSGLDGVERIVTAFVSPDADEYRALVTADDARALGATDIPAGRVVGIDIYGMMADNGDGAGITLDPPAASEASLDGLTPSAVLVVTDGTLATVERVKTAMTLTSGDSQPAMTRGDAVLLSGTGSNEELAVMAYLGMGIAIAIVALALTVATAAAVLDRRRTFGLLRLGGMPVSQLRLTTVVEAAVPLAVTLLASGGLGWLIAWAVLESLSNDLSVAWPDPRYWWALGVSMAVAVFSLVSTFGTVRRSTELASTRFE